MSIAENVDEKGILKIRNLVGRYGLRSFLEAVFLEVHDTAGRYGDEEELGEEHVLKEGADDEDFLEARRVHDKLNPIIGWKE